MNASVIVRCSEHILTTTCFDSIKFKVIIHKNQVVSELIYRYFRIFFALEHQDKNFNAILEGPLNKVLLLLLLLLQYYHGRTMMLMGSDSDTSELTMSPIRTCRKQQEHQASYFLLSHRSSE